jgi:outer membrane protein assembly factor BamB
MLEDNVLPLRAASPLPTRQSGGDPFGELRELLLGDANPALELPALPDLIAAVCALASGARRKALLPLRDTPIELALVRRGEHVLIDCYGTDGTPELLLREREIELRSMIDACAEASRRSASATPERATASGLEQLAERLGTLALQPDVHAQLGALRCSGGSLDSPGPDVPLAFGFTAEIVPNPDAAPEALAFDDVHALLFSGRLWAFAGGRRLTVVEGPIALAVQRMVAAVRALCDAWQAERNVHVRLRSADFWVAVRRERGGSVALTLRGGRAEAVTWPALSVREAALPILRLATDLMRKLVAADRRQSHNLRLSALRAEIRALRNIIRVRERVQSFENRDPDRLRLSAAEASAAAGELVAAERPSQRTAAIALERSPQLQALQAGSVSQGGAAPAAAPQAATLRYTERWSAEVDGLDASAVYLCGDRLVVATQKLTLAFARGTGEVLWTQPSAGATTMLAGRTLLRRLPDGELALHDVENGHAYASTRVWARGSSEISGLYATSASFPPLAILADARPALTAIDLRTGQPRWRFRMHGQGVPQLARSGRVLCVTSGDGTVDALDLATGETVWRFGEHVRFCVKPLVCRDVVIAVAGEPRGGAGSVFGIDLYSGKRLWQRELPAAPSCDPVDAGSIAIIPIGRSRQAKLIAIDPQRGSVLWRESDPGLDNGGQALAIDRLLIVNTPAGRVHALEIETGASCWNRALSNPLTDDVPRQLEPRLRQGALFVPSAQLHVLRPHDGSTLGQPGCDLVPDSLRVDERGWFYVAEESGHLRAYGAAPHLSLVR